MGFEVNSLNFLLYTQRITGRTRFNNVATMERLSFKALPKSYLEFSRADKICDRNPSLTKFSVSDLLRKRIG